MSFTYTLVNGILYIRHGKRLFVAFQNAPRFQDAAAAEQWLSDNDVRGNIQEAAVAGA